MRLLTAPPGSSTRAARRRALAGACAGATLVATLLQAVPTAAAAAEAPSSSLPSGSAQFELAATGRFAELAERLGAVPLARLPALADVHALCFALSQVKRYDDEAACLDEMARRLAAGDRHTRFFDLQDGTIALHLMRAEVEIDFDRPERARDETTAALLRIQQGDDDLPDMQMVAHAMAALADARQDRRADALAEREIVAGINSGWWIESNGVRTSRALLLARIDMALGRWNEAYDELADDASFAINAFVDNLFSGAYLRGIDQWRWQSLPRAYMLYKAALETGRVAQAREGLDRLLAIPEAADNVEIHRLMLVDRARIAEEFDHDLPAAFTGYAAAIRLIEAARLSIAPEASKIGFVGDKQAVYGRIVSVAQRLGRAEDAAEYAERARSRALVDLLAGRRQFAAAATPAASDAARASPDTLVAALDRADREARVQFDGGRQRAAAAREAAAVREIDLQYPALSALVHVGAPPISELQSRIAPDETVLQYYVYGDTVYLFAIDRGAVRMTIADGHGLERAVNRFRESIRLRRPDVTSQARALYDRLVRPMAAGLEGRALVIVPHGPLHYLPFAALNDGAGWLAERHPLRMLPALAVLAPPGEASAGTPFSGQDLVLFGDPDLGDPSAALPHAREEVLAIAARAPGAQVFLGAQATKERFLAEAATHRIVHLASHGRFNADLPLRSALYLAPAARDDGRLTADDLYALRLPADLVVLSACETGLARVADGDELIGLIRGFLYAGTGAVVASLWAVDDGATAMLMTRFHTALATPGARRADALRQAQLAVMAQQPEPYFWAGFFLVGKDL